jgi:hypothetical protein
LARENDKKLDKPQIDRVIKVTELIEAGTEEPHAGASVAPALWLSLEHPL